MRKSCIKNIFSPISLRKRCRKKPILYKEDVAAGTIIGIAIITIVSFLLISLCGLGYLLIERSRLQAISDTVALSSAEQLLYSQSQVCAISQKLSRDNGAHLKSCKATDNDVTIELSHSTHIPFLPYITSSSRAGIRACLPRGS